MSLFQICNLVFFIPFKLVLISLPNAVVLTDIHTLKKLHLVMIKCFFFPFSGKTTRCYASTKTWTFLKSHRVSLSWSVVTSQSQQWDETLETMRVYKCVINASSGSGRSRSDRFFFFHLSEDPSVRPPAAGDHPVRISAPLLPGEFPRRMAKCCRLELFADDCTAQ